eukprot:TRINITY_DN976_c0_g1_i1.p1 TRINITY_DN976_c0_g1~~TRINITY_DN976_c0_g1_i1.p1  ORF type:complete len:196 (-),score=40.19 TRINITY_DN976_c0_g1_i1:326-913(-)
MPSFFASCTYLPAGMWFGGSLVSQLVEQRKAIKEKGFKEGFKLDKRRMGFDTVWGTIFGSQLNVFTRFMTRQVPNSIGKRTIISWLIVSPILNFEYLLARSSVDSWFAQKDNALMAPEDVTTTQKKKAETDWYVKQVITKKFPGTLVKSACVWPGSFFANYRFIPVNWSPFFMNFVGVTWSAIMSNAGTTKKKSV